MLLIKVISFFFNQKIWYLSKTIKLKNIYIWKKADKKFIIDSSPCVYPPNESCDEVDISKKGRKLFKIKYRKNQVVNTLHYTKKQALDGLDE